MNTIIRVAKNSNYSVISNVCLRDDSISLKAKGLFAYIMTLPDDWSIYQSELVKHFSDGITALSSAMGELETKGYIHKRKVRTPDGKLNGWEYIVYENPNTDSPNLEKPISVNPRPENPKLPSTDDNQDTNSTKNTLCGFDDFWNVWPKHKRKVGRPQCMALWRTGKLYECHTDVIEGLKAWANSDDWLKDGGKWIPFPAKWLRNQMWESAGAIKAAAVCKPIDKMNLPF